MGLGVLLLSSPKFCVSHDAIQTGREREIVSSWGKELQASLLESQNLAPGRLGECSERSCNKM